jgi:hypothetical protein
MGVWSTKDVIGILAPLISAAATLIPVLLATFNSKKVLGEKLDQTVQSVSLLLMHDEHLSLDSRIAAGDRFIAAGGNGAGKLFHHELLRQYEGQLKERGVE